MECICESTRLRLLGEREAAAAIAHGVDQLDVERVWSAVDFLKNAALECHGQWVFDQAEGLLEQALRWCRND